MKHNNLYAKVLSLLLTTVILISSFTNQVFANDQVITNQSSQGNVVNVEEEGIKVFDEISKKELNKWRKDNTSKTETESISNFEDNYTQKSNEEVFMELKNKRESNIKHFYDGKNYEAVIYPYPVHYKEDGKWKDIDNSLVEVNDDENEVVAGNTAKAMSSRKTNKQKIYKIKQNDFTLKLAKKANAKKLITIKKDNYSLSWNIESTNNSKIEFVHFDTQYNALSKKEKKKTLKNISSIAIYKEALPNIDLNYHILPTQVKENFVIKAYRQNLEINMNINVNGLKAKRLDDNSIIFYDKKTTKTIFTIPTPFMYDDNGEVSYDINVNLKKIKNNQYKITLKPDDAWLNDSNRKYPVVLDPTTQTDRNASNIFDTYVSQNYPNDNFHTIDRLKVGKGSSSGINYTYIKFNLPALPDGAVVNEAILNMYTMNDNNEPTNVVARHTTQPWTSNQLKWSSQPGWDGTYDAYKTITAKGKQSWVISQIVSNWYNGTTLNNGLVIKAVENDAEYTEFYSSDNGNYNYRPQITINYSGNQIPPEPLGDTFNITTPTEGILGELFNITSSISNAHHIAVKITKPDGSVEWMEQNGENFSSNYTPTMTGIYTIQALARNTATAQDIGTEVKSSAIKTISIYAALPLGNMTFSTPEKGVKNSAFSISSSWKNAHHVAIKVTKPDGVEEWFVNNGETYNFNYTPTTAGLYSIKLYARNTETADDAGTEVKESESKYIAIYFQQGYEPTNDFDKYIDEQSQLLRDLIYENNEHLKYEYLQDFTMEDYKRVVLISYYTDETVNELYLRNKGWYDWAKNNLEINGYDTSAPGMKTSITFAAHAQMENSKWYDQLKLVLGVSYILNSTITLAREKFLKKGNYVYRAITEADYKRLQQGQGLQPKNPQGKWTLEQHVIDGSYKSSLVNDPYFSTTTDINVAKGFDSGYGIIRIDLNKVPSNTIYNTFNMFPRNGGLGPEAVAYQYSVWQQEISIKGNIIYDAIKILN